MILSWFLVNSVPRARPCLTVLLWCLYQELYFQSHRASYTISLQQKAFQAPDAGLVFCLWPLVREYETAEDISLKCLSWNCSAHFLLQVSFSDSPRAALHDSQFIIIPLYLTLGLGPLSETSCCRFVLLKTDLLIWNESLLKLLPCLQLAVYFSHMLNVHISQAYVSHKISLIHFGITLHYTSSGMSFSTESKHQEGHLSVNHIFDLCNILGYLKLECFYIVYSFCSVLERCDITASGITKVFWFRFMSKKGGC